MDLSTRTIAPLRSDLELITDSHERLPYAALDRTLGQKVRLDKTGFTVASALVTQWEPPELLIALAQQGLRLSPQLLVKLIRFFDAHLLLDTPRAAVRISAETSLSEPTSTTIEFYPGTKHQCVSCGHSCSAHDIGPVDPQRVDSIRAHFPDDRFRYRDTGDAESTGHYCGMTGDQCNFLNESNLCRIHALHGASAKPTDCQLFPLTFTRTPSGVVGGVRMECRSYIESKRAATVECGDLDDIASLYSKLAWVDEISPLVRVDDLFTVPYGEYETWEASIVSRINDSAPVLWKTANAVNQLWHERLTHAREEDRNSWVFPPETPPIDRARPDEFLKKFADACQTALRMNAACKNILRVAQLERVLYAIEQLRNTTLPAPNYSADADELMRDYLRQSVQLKSALKGPSVRFGWAIINFSMLLAVAGAPKSHLNQALSDALKVLRCGPVMQCLHEEIDPVICCFHTHFADWI